LFEAERMQIVKENVEAKYSNKVGGVYISKDGRYQNWRSNISKFQKAREKTSIFCTQYTEQIL